MREGIGVKEGRSEGVSECSQCTHVPSVSVCRHPRHGAPSPTSSSTWFASRCADDADEDADAAPAVDEGVVDDDDDVVMWRTPPPPPLPPATPLLLLPLLLLPLVAVVPVAAAAV